MFINFNEISKGVSLQEQQKEYYSFFNKYAAKANNVLQDFEQQKKLINSNVEDLPQEDLSKLEQIIVDRFITFGKRPLNVDVIKSHQELLQEELNSEEVLENEKYFSDLFTENAYYRDKCYCFTASREEFFKNYDYIFKVCKESLEDGRQVKFLINQSMKSQTPNGTVNYVFTKEEFNKLIEFNNNLKQLGMEENIRVNELEIVNSANDFKNSWELEQVKLANEKIFEVVNYIKSNNFTPYEAMIYIHKYITSNFEFQEAEGEKSRTVVSVFNGDGIVCAGYSSLTKAIIDNLGYKDLTCDFLTCRIYKKGIFPDLLSSHVQNLIHIKDEKYNINGHYINDACWDSKNSQNKNGKGFACFMFPVEDVLNFKNEIYYECSPHDRFDAIIENGEYAAEIEDVANAGVFKLLKHVFSEKKEINKHVPKVITNYGENSKPIIKKKLKQGLKVVLSKENKTEEEILSDINDIGRHTIKNSKFIFNKNAKNYNVINSLENGLEQ